MGILAEKIKNGKKPVLQLIVCPDCGLTIHINDELYGPIPWTQNLELRMLGIKSDDIAEMSKNVVGLIDELVDEWIEGQRVGNNKTN